MKACYSQIEALLKAWHDDNNITPPDPDLPPTPSERKATEGKNLSTFYVTRMLNDMVGVNLLEIGGDVNGWTILEIIAETVKDLHQFPSANHFASWLGLAPNNFLVKREKLSFAP